MGTRIELHTVLCNILGTTHVYFQPPETIKLVYPCIIYELSNVQTNYADNKPYTKYRKYTVTLIDKRPESPIADDIGQLPMSKWNRHFTSDNLHHFVFDLYF